MYLLDLAKGIRGWVLGAQKMPRAGPKMVWGPKRPPARSPGPGHPLTAPDWKAGWESSIRDPIGALTPHPPSRWASCSPTGGSKCQGPDYSRPGAGVRTVNPTGARTLPSTDRGPDGEGRVPVGGLHGRGPKVLGWLVSRSCQQIEVPGPGLGGIQVPRSGVGAIRRG